MEIGDLRRRAKCYMQILKESGCGRGRKVGGREHVWLIAIDYHAATGTAGMDTEETKDQRGLDGQSPEWTLAALQETQESRRLRDRARGWIKAM